ncbi:MAG: hypothetical protein AAGH15_11735 [Myxococcota bacterium]
MIGRRTHASVSLLALALVALSAAPAAADLPEGVRFDDAFAHYRVQTRSSISNGQPSEGWYLEAQAQLLGTGIAPGSAFRFVLKSGRRVLGQKTCDGTLDRFGVERDAPPNRFWVTVCKDTDLRLTATGPITVEVFFIDNATEAETLVRTHTVDMRRVAKSDRDGGDLPGEYFINRHADVAAMVIEQHPGFTTRTRSRLHTVHLHAWAAVEGYVASPRLRCSVDGEHVPLPYDRVGASSDDEHVREVRVVRGERRTEREEIRFRRYTYELPLTFGADPEGHRQNYFDLGSKPGAWECQVRDEERRAFRVFRFQVDAAGQIAAHPEEAAGLSLPDGWHLLDADVPADSPLDARTDPAAARAGAFYGRAWATPEGRAMGGRLPAIGSPYPPSARLRGARRGRRR